MFDIIPDSAFQKNEQIPDLVIEAKNKCRKIFRDLPDSIERNSILDALGRIGKKNVRHKIEDRYQIIENSGFITLQDIKLVIKQCVLCRNFFVHGSTPAFDYIESFNEFCFLIDTLKFIYAISELIEIGWTFQHWEANDLNLHPFSRYLINYEMNVKNLQNILIESKC